MLNTSRVREIADGTINIDEDYLRANGIAIRINPMSYEIKGLSFPCGSWYQIQINSEIPLDQQWDALLHELTHIAKNDFTRSDPVEVIEGENSF